MSHFLKFLLQGLFSHLELTSTHFLAPWQQAQECSVEGYP